MALRRLRVPISCSTHQNTLIDVFQITLCEFVAKAKLYLSLQSLLHPFIFSLLSYILYIVYSTHL